MQSMKFALLPKQQKLIELLEKIPPAKPSKVGARDYTNERDKWVERLIHFDETGDLNGWKVFAMSQKAYENPKIQVMLRDYLNEVIMVSLLEGVHPTSVHQRQAFVKKALPIQKLAKELTLDLTVETKLEKLQHHVEGFTKGTIRDGLLHCIKCMIREHSGSKDTILAKMRTTKRYDGAVDIIEQRLNNLLREFDIDP